MQPTQPREHAREVQRSETCPTEFYRQVQLPQGDGSARLPLQRHPSLSGEHLATGYETRLYPQLRNESSQTTSGVNPAVQTDNSFHSGTVDPRPPRKKALIVGCNYPSSPNDRLRSCVNDALAMGHMLTERFGYPPENVRLLVDEVDSYTHFPTTQSFPPTRQNIIKSIKWLVQDARAEDKLFFHFSGHGTCSADYYGEEKNGSNQCIMPTDYEESGVLVDDDINRFLIRPLPKDCILHALVDCCHSGTIMDLEFLFEGRGWACQGPTRNYKGTDGGFVFQFAACRDGQRAYEPASQYTTCGAATAAFINAILSADRVTYGIVLRMMERQVRSATASEGIWQRMKEVWKKPTQFVLGRQYQKPQLSSNTDEIPLSAEIHI